MVHVGQSALPLISVGGEVLLEPLRLGGARTATDLSSHSTVAVEGDYVPAPQVVGVVTLIRISCSLPEVVEVACCPFGFVFVVSEGGPGALLELSPGRLVAVPEVLSRSVWVGVVAQGEHRGAVDGTDELGCFLVAVASAIGDVASSDDDIPGRKSRGALRSAAKGEETPQERDEDCRGEPRSPPPGFRRTNQERGHRS